MAEESSQNISNVDDAAEATEMLTNHRNY